MAKVSPYHTNETEYPPEHRNVHHDHDDCAEGKKIKPCSTMSRGQSGEMIGDRGLFELRGTRAAHETLQAGRLFFGCIHSTKPLQHWPTSPRLHLTLVRCRPHLDVARTIRRRVSV
jgi:hypothetical protein